MKWLLRLFKRRAAIDVRIRPTDAALKATIDGWNEAVASMLGDVAPQYGGHTDPRMKSLLDLVRDVGAFPEDMSGDPLDLESGDVVVNQSGEVRFVLDTNTHEGPLEFSYMDLLTARCSRASANEWVEWTGPCVWHVWNRTGTRWEFRSPFADPFNMEGLARDESTFTMKGETQSGRSPATEAP